MSTLVASNIEAPEDGEYPGRAISMEHLVRSACLSWLFFGQDNANTIYGSMNIASVTDVAAGEHDGNFTSLPEAATAVMQCSLNNGADTITGRRPATTTEFTVLTYDMSSSAYLDREVSTTVRGVFA